MSTSDHTTGGGPKAVCAHPACACPAGPNGYCSARCEEPPGTDPAGERESCRCGHAECEAAVVDVSDPEV